MGDLTRYCIGYTNCGFELLPNLRESSYLSLMHSERDFLTYKPLLEENWLAWMIQ